MIAKHHLTHKKCTTLNKHHQSGRLMQCHHPHHLWVDVVDSSGVVLENIKFLWGGKNQIVYDPTLLPAENVH